MNKIVNPTTTLPDPRIFRNAAEAPAESAHWYALARRSLEASTGGPATSVDTELCRLLRDAILVDGAALEAAILDAPSPAIARHLWCEVDQAWRTLPQALGPDVALTLFAIPVVIVAGIVSEPAAAERAVLGTTGGALDRGVDVATRVAGAAITLPGTLSEMSAVVAVLRAGRALAGNETVVLGNALVSARSLRVGQLGAWHRWQQMISLGNTLAIEHGDLLAPAPIRVSCANEAAHLRFLVGSALAATEADLLADDNVSIWGTPLARELVRLMAHATVSVLALPRAPGRPLPAHYRGLCAQREVSAQLFATNAIRKLRASVGEPTAVISAHRCQSAPGGGELRLSLSSPFEPRDADGFCCPIYAIERVNDVVLMLRDLMADCRVADVRLAPGIHPDRVGKTDMRVGETDVRIAGTDMPLLFKPETIPGAFS